MLNILKRNDITTTITWVALGVFFRLYYVLNPPLSTQLDFFQKGLFFEWSGLLHFYESFPRLYVVLSVIPFLIFSFYINVVLNNEKIFARKSFIPSVAFILYSSFLSFTCVCSMVFVANVFIFIAFAQIISLNTKGNPTKNLFTIGFFVALASFFYFPACLFFIMFIILWFIIRPFKLQELIAYILGLCTPYYFLMTISFLLGKWRSTMQQLYFHFHLPIKIFSTPIFIIMSSLSIVLLVYGFYLANQSQGRNTITIRKKWNSIGLYFIFSCIVAIFSTYFPSVSWIIAITPFSIVLSQSLQNYKEKFNTFTFYFLLIMLIIVQWLLH